MTRLESEIVSVKKPAKEVFDWLCNLNNYEKLMPEQVEDWVSTEQDCSFSIKGMASLGMELREKMPDKQITFVRKGKAPFDFTLFCNVTETGPEQTELQLVFDADMNPFLKMMAEKPLTSFLNILVRKYRELTIS